MYDIDTQSLLLRNTIHCLTQTILKARPIVLSGPLPEEMSCNRLIGRSWELAGVRKIFDKLLARVELPEDCQRIVDVEWNSPGVDPLILGLGIDEGTDMDDGDILDIDVDN